MKFRASLHLLVLLVIVALTALAFYTVYRGALIRGYEAAPIYAYRNLLFLIPLLLMPVILSGILRYKGSWTIFTTAVLLFSLGLVGQYRLFSDPEYSSRSNKAEAREQKIQTLQLRYIKENYSVDKKKLMGVTPANPPGPVSLDDETPRPSKYSINDAIWDAGTRNTIIAFIAFLLAYIFFKRDSILDFLQKNGFLVVFLTLPPLLLAAFTSSSGKAIQNMTPWEPSKIPFLLGFAGVLTLLYRNLAKTYWGIPRAQDVIPLFFMAILPFVPFLVLKDFGQMLVFSFAYITLYLISVRRWPQRFVFVGSVVFLLSLLIVGSLPERIKNNVPFLTTLASPITSRLPDRIHQRFHLWFDGLTPPPVDKEKFGWWYKDLRTFYVTEYKEDLGRLRPETLPMYAELEKKETSSSRKAEIRTGLNKIADEEIADLAVSDPDRLRGINEEAWFSDDALQSSRATFGISSGGKTGRGLGLGYVELIPVAESDYIYSAIGEELGLAGGLIITMALIIFVMAGTRTALDARDMFSKLCAAGLTAFIGFQGLVNMGGITRALPMTGITLPFVSHGGFSLITSFAMLGMLMAISHRNAVDAQMFTAPNK